ncbi:MAG: hypothetical protein ACLFPF_09475 [Halanaerobiales bacterium]
MICIKKQLEDIIGKEEKILVKDSDCFKWVYYMLILFFLLSLLAVIIVLLFYNVENKQIFSRLIILLLLIEVFILYLRNNRVLALTDKYLYFKRFLKVRQIHLSEIKNIKAVKAKAIYIQIDLKNGGYLKAFNSDEISINQLCKNFQEQKKLNNEN